MRWGAGKGFHVPGLAIKDCKSVDDMLNVRPRLFSQAIMEGSLLTLNTNGSTHPDARRLRVPCDSFEDAHVLKVKGRCQYKCNSDQLEPTFARFLYSLDNCVWL